MPDINQPSESVGNIPHSSESVGNLPNHAEDFRSILKPSERKESHTLTVREVARMFEAAGVARTERSIINWCHPNKLGVSRLDAYFDPNERKFFVTPQSVELAIKEEEAKAAQSNSSDGLGSVPNPLEDRGNTGDAVGHREQSKTLEQENMDLKITNRAKDFFIEQLQKERKDYVDQLMIASRRVGELETKVLHLESSKLGLEDGSTRTST